MDQHLRRLGVNTVVVAGCIYPNCPRATVYGASERDYRVVVVSDAISGVQPDDLDEARLMGIAHASSGQVVNAVRALTHATSQHSSAPRG